MISPPDSVMPEIVLSTMSRDVHSTGLTNSSNGGDQARDCEIRAADRRRTDCSRCPIGHEVADAQQDARGNTKEYPHASASVRDWYALGQRRRRIGWVFVTVADTADTAVRHPLGRSPSAQQLGVGLEHLDSQGVAVRLRIRALAPQRHREVAAWAQRDGHQQIDLGEQFEIVARVAPGTSS